MQLICHPDTPATAVERVSVHLSTTPIPGELWCEFHVASNSLLLPPAASPERTDGLWKTTCFELFARPAGGDAYFEFNFSPSFRWAAYSFDGYRSGMQDFPAEDPDIWVTPGPPHFFLAVEAMPRLPSVSTAIALSAVIEETDGTKSYWALAHPSDKPDFHHPDGFVLELPAP
ncbi:DOMON-like domain-containing protein [Sphingomonas sp. ST-64]|uniref:DOMON-like domain-containing protein n=1 Tax=Sphingomonas plantiphila TaxID=3163295 RepID=A0ABW8YN14_9SPHN